MNLYTLILAIAVSLTKTEAQAIIGHHQVRPFKQPVPNTSAQEVAVRFKPQLNIKDGCHPYPAVQKDGTVNGGLEWSGAQDGECTGSKLGSQIYARSALFNNMWAIIYAWYFPKGRALLSPFSFGLAGHRHNWEHVVLWIDGHNNGELDIEELSIISVAVPGSFGYDIQFPHQKFMNGTSIKLEYYYSDLLGTTSLELTEDSGEVQDLITWNQLSVLARYSLNHMDWDTSMLELAGVTMPLKDGEFEAILDKTWPFDD